METLLQTLDCVVGIVIAAATTHQAPQKPDVNMPACSEVGSQDPKVGIGPKWHGGTDYAAPMTPSQVCIPVSIKHIKVKART